MSEPTVLLIGALDTKGEEYAFVASLLRREGLSVLTMDIGVVGEPFHILSHISAETVAERGGEHLGTLRKRADRGHAMDVMSRGAAILTRELFETGRIQGVFGMGGSGGTSVISAAMRELPVGVPKVLVSTMASGNTSPIVDTRDIVLIPAVVDVAGLNQISRTIFTEAVGAICGMLRIRETSISASEAETEHPVVAITMFGNTTECVTRCRELLTRAGCEVLAFHCTGVGGRTMEDLVEDGRVAAVLDITTTEWADELCGGVLSAGPHRLEAPGHRGIPHLIVPGCLDMVNFGPISSVPERFRHRTFYVWNPQVTLMRTTPEENQALGQILADKANQAQGPVAFLLPLKGLSVLDAPGNPFWWPEADTALFSAIRHHVREGIPVEDVDANINDVEFAEKAVATLLDMFGRAKNESCP
ncbi:MAG: Tm-1-like ATP-binding domain-containing protein [Alicyclobacillus herbarius]|uniref:Tm-1-like ATP-binding domain-containing protein n=1 Tax=Alicyclobacillus herbarius TaxID=122960 RepID=UPI000405F49A|nr:Tm-1-like ATP-binding domain-containing protein [Alicyclobacillus herbarius]MCL6632280.1 Tm-1-like ATP-binding domain-containing protein [Alicyclobacillus herbarius]